MKFKTTGSLLLGLALVLTLSISARSDGDRRDNDDRNGDRARDRDRDCIISDHHEDNKNTPVKLIGIIAIPGPNPLVSADIAWGDTGTERYYVSDSSNAGVDIIDADDDVWVARVTGFHGVLPSGGGTSTTNGGGPNGVLVTPGRKLWAGDGNSTAEVADVDPNSAIFPGAPVGISTAWNNPSIAADTCDSATLHYCGRADELAYDSKDHIIMIANNAPLSLTATGTPPVHTPIDPYATFIKSDPPYTVLGHISFPGAGGLEQPLWDVEKQRFLVTVPGKLVSGVVVTKPSIQVVNPLTMMSEATYVVDCSTIPGVAGPLPNVGITGIALAPYGHILVSACGSPIILTLKATPTPHINVLFVTNTIGGGDEVWYNPGDGRFYVTGRVPPVVVAPAVNVQELGVLDAEDSTLLQTVSQFGLRGKNPAAFSENNHIFTIQAIAAGQVANPTPPTVAIPDDSVCAHYGFVHTGCIAVFEHTEPGEVNAQ